MALQVEPECSKGGALQALESYLLEHGAVQVVHGGRGGGGGALPLPMVIWVRYEMKSVVARPTDSILTLAHHLHTMSSLASKIILTVGILLLLNAGYSAIQRMLWISLWLGDGIYTEFTLLIAQTRRSHISKACGGAFYRSACGRMSVSF